MTDDNCPAFPFTGESEKGYFDYAGLTKREFAAISFMKALIGIEADLLITAIIQQRGDDIDLSKPTWIAVLRAKTAIAYADALFRELES